MDEPGADDAGVSVELGRRLEQAAAWSRRAPVANEVIGLHRAYNRARGAMARQRQDEPLRRRLEAQVLQARILLGAARPTSALRALGEALRELASGLRPARPFVLLALLVVLSSWMVGYLAIDADSRLGDLLLMGSGGRGELAGLRDPVGALAVAALGTSLARPLVCGALRFVLLQGIFLGGLALGLIPTLALAHLGLSWGVTMAQPQVTSTSALAAMGQVAPDAVALILAAAGGLLLSHSSMSPGRRTRSQALAAGLRMGAVLWMFGVLSHLLSGLPAGPLRVVGAMAVLLATLVGRRRACRS